MLEFDRRILAGLHALRRPWLDDAVAALTWLGSIAVLLPLALLLARQRWRDTRRIADAVLPVLAVAGASALAAIGKSLFGRPRPDANLGLTAVLTDFSFPSAHAMQISAFALAWLLCAKNGFGWPGSIVAAALVLGVAASRAYLHVHFPSDVVAGIVAGLAWTFGLKFLLLHSWRRVG